jgi:hypothetical protein
MVWAFRILVALNLVLLAVALFYQAPGEDPAGAGMRMGFAVFFGIALALMLALYHFAKTDWIRVPILVVLTVPFLSIGYGIFLSL